MMLNKITISLALTILLSKIALSQGVAESFDKKYKHKWELSLGPSLVNYQIVSFEDQVYPFNPYKSRTPRFDFGYIIGLDFSWSLTRRCFAGIGSRLQFKGGRFGFGDLTGPTISNDDVMYALLLIKVEYLVQSRISLYNAISYGVEAGNVLDTEGDEIALLTGIKLHLSKRWSSVICYNQGMNKINIGMNPRYKRRFYSFDLTFGYTLNNYSRQ